MVRLKVPFFANTPDDTHCFQASIRMILKYFLPEKNFAWNELDEMTAKKEDKWTWPMAGLINLKNMGFEVADLEDFNYERFAAEGEVYLSEIYGKETASAQAENSDLDQERKLAREFLKEFGRKNKLPKEGDIKDYLKKGYLVCCNVNANILDGEEGYLGHFVIVTGFDDKYFYVNDPGSPPRQDAKIAFSQFKKAWAYPDNKAKNIMAFKWRL